MNDRSPCFEKPPVVETAIGVQFAALPGFTQVHFGKYHCVVSERFPVAEDQPRLQRLSETFPRQPRIQGIRFESAGLPDRVFYRDRIDGSQLIQLQPDRFGFNWCKSVTEEHYPSFGVNSGTFLREYEGFVAFCRDNGLGEVRPDIVEVIYVNHIFPLAEETAQDLFDRVFSASIARHFDSYLPAPASTSLNRVFEPDGQRGRLYAEASVAMHKERGEFLAFQMVARVRATGDSIADDIVVAHDWIVNGFVSLTSPEMRSKRWKQIR